MLEFDDCQCVNLNTWLNNMDARLEKFDLPCLSMLAEDDFKLELDLMSSSNNAGLECLQQFDWELPSEVEQDVVPTPPRSPKREAPDSSTALISNEVDPFLTDSLTLYRSQCQVCKKDGVSLSDGKCKECKWRKHISRITGNLSILAMAELNRQGTLVTNSTDPEDAELFQVVNPSAVLECSSTTYNDHCYHQMPSTSTNQFTRAQLPNTWTRGIPEDTPSDSDDDDDDDDTDDDDDDTDDEDEEIDVCETSSLSSPPAPPVVVSKKEAAIVKSIVPRRGRLPKSASNSAHQLPGGGISEVTTTTPSLSSNSNSKSSLKRTANNKCSNKGRTTKRKRTQMVHHNTSSNSRSSAAASKHSSRHSSNRCIFDGTDSERRSMHNSMERKRRDFIRFSFQHLRDQIPQIQNNPRASKVLILNKATEYAHELSRIGKVLDRTLLCEQRRKDRLEKALRQLKSAMTK